MKPVLRKGTIIKKGSKYYAVASANSKYIYCVDEKNIDRLLKRDMTKIAIIKTKTIIVHRDIVACIKNATTKTISHPINKAWLSIVTESIQFIKVHSLYFSEPIICRVVNTKVKNNSINLEIRYESWATMYDKP